ncbi:alkaline phosphatase PhoX [Prochlorothrix hollandica]|uniref:Phosphatase n=1 Tax=Prochlorothrix hollandica PCC 9006 = CALU 1027 TaxID=317619 RepID=A0A0M2PRR7_PROHO|nr:alkaline phosphatase PhoX [Prochlorothrix hollandica]KKI99240.1 phosphatase [Prochlorothrix hollandica PCC 9006 = CALU 1027]
MSFSRRRFLSLAGSSTLGVTLGLPLLSCYGKVAQGTAHQSLGYGALTPQLPQNAAELTQTIIGDLSGTPLLALPPGFQYRALSISGQTMADGSLVPPKHDGMGAFAGRSGQTILVRNHEIDLEEAHLGLAAGVVAAAGRKYSTGATGGTTTLVIDGDRRLIRDFVSLGGTARNCAGGTTPWGSWITCEETFRVSRTTDEQTRFHGYAFEVPAQDQVGTADPLPLEAMGRFVREAIAVDPATGTVYQTEDQGDSCFYRFIPQVPGQLSQGGRLYALRFKDYPQGINTSNNRYLGGKEGSIAVGQTFAVDWVPIANPNPRPELNAGDQPVRHQAQQQGAAVFFRGEGIGYSNGLIYFTATQGGATDAGQVLNPILSDRRGNGQVWVYDPAQETLTLWVEADPSGALLDEPDNLTMAPFGDLFLCEDGGGEQFLVGVKPQGDLYQFAKNTLDNREFAGVCFAPDGQTLFVNSQGLGVTYAIWGPWV